jgi:cytochrome c-type biogenesis protein CcmH
VTRTSIAWAALAVAVLVAVVIALAGGGDPKATPAERADAIAHNVRCPTCRGQSVAESASPAAQAIRTEVRRRIDAGQSRQQIEAYLETRYGSDILLTPPRSGIGGLVWVLPVVAIVVSAGGLALALQRWTRMRRAWSAEESA